MWLPTIKVIDAGSEQPLSKNAYMKKNRHRKLIQDGGGYGIFKNK